MLGGVDTFEYFMEVLNDFEESEADERRETEGILIKGDSRLLKFEDGQMINFGLDQLNEV